MRSLTQLGTLKLQNIVASVLFSLVFSSFTAFGFTSKIVNEEGCSRVELLFCLIMLLLVCIPVSYFLISIVSRISADRFFLTKIPCFIKKWGALFAFTVLLWGVFWLLFYPGYFSPDSMDSFFQALGAKELKNHHPLVFTALVMPFAWFGNAVGNIEVGMALFSLLTMLFLAAVSSYIATWIRVRTGSNKLFVFCIIFLVTNPLVIEYSHAGLKDVWFAGFVAMFALSIVNFLLSRNKRNVLLIQIGLFGLLVCLFRGNGVFLVFPTLLAMAIFVKPRRLYIVTTLIACIVGYFLITGPVYSLFNAKSAGFEETVGVPLQQISRTLVDNGTVSKENEAFLEELFDVTEIKEAYDPYLVDPVKWSEGFDSAFLGENKFQFFYVWGQILLDNPKSYLIAWRDATLGYWFVGINDDICTGAGYEWLPAFDQYSEKIAFPQDRHQNGNTLFYDTVSIEQYNSVIDDLRSIPILNVCFNLAVPSWLFVFLGIIFLAQKRRESFVAILPFLMLFFTMLIAAPTYYAWRYMLASYLLIPFALALLFYRMPNESNGTKRISYSKPKTD